MDAFVPTYIGFILVLTRTASLCMVAPLFGMKPVPVRVRMGLSLALAFTAFTAAGLPPFPRASDVGALMVAGLSETLIGVSAGLVGRLAIETANAAGHAIGLSMGLGFANVVDPLHGAESTALSELLFFVALAIAVGMGIHRDAVVWLCRSVIEQPPGSAVSIPEIAARVVGESARSAAMCIRLAFPVTGAITLGHVSLGVMSRVAPQMNLGSLGFSVAILAGGAALYVTAPTVAELVARSAQAALVGR